MQQGQAKKASEQAQRDLVTLGVALGAILLFVGTGSSVLPAALRSIIAGGPAPDQLLTNALILNIALIIFGWRRYRELSAEMDERRKAEAYARKLAETDALTGCLNRHAVYQAANHLLAEASEEGQVVAFLMIDLDNFKTINDYNGHSAGDQFLVECARRLTDMMPADAVIARLGGDEFACMYRFDPRQGDSVDHRASLLIEALSRPIQAGGISVETTISVGVTRSDLRSEDGDRPRDAEALLHMADIAMYNAKKQGRNRYFWFEPSMESELRFRSELEAGIRRGIPLGEFVPFFEQQIDLSTGKLVGFEVLARWKSPTLGTVSPEVFIPIAEDIGVIADLSESVIRQALTEAATWDSSLTLSINISPLQLRDPWFAQKLLKILVETNFPPARLDVEITESCLHENVGVVRTLITSLKNQGISISLDDFGTGYSSLSQLRTLPFDRIKIDRSFITSLPGSKDSETIVQAITSLGDGLGMPITAEGIETEEVLGLVKKFGEFKGQGYLYGRPQSIDDTTRLLADKEMLGKSEPAAPARQPEPASQGRRRSA